jgi:hypothetical protein
MIFYPFEYERASTYLKKLFDRKRTVRIEYLTESKTISQNNYAWLIFTHVANETGNTKKDIYQLCLSRFPFHKEIEINGELHAIPITLSGMSRDQMREFIDQFTMFFRTEGFSIPEPEDKRTKEMYDYYKQRGLM